MDKFNIGDKVVMMDYFEQSEACAYVGQIGVITDSIQDYLNPEKTIYTIDTSMGNIYASAGFKKLVSAFKITIFRHSNRPVIYNTGLYDTMDEAVNGILHEEFHFLYNYETTDKNELKATIKRINKYSGNPETIVIEKIIK